MAEITDDELLAEAEESHNRRVSESEAELRREVEAILLVKRLREKRASQSLLPKDGAQPDVIHKAQVAPVPAPRILVHEDGEEWPGLRNVILRVANAKGIFSLDEVLHYIRDTYPTKFEKLERVDVSRELWRSKEKGDIEVAQEGAGKRPAIYKKKASEPEAQGASA